MKSKTIFRLGVGVFLIGIGIISYDMGRRTTFPGSKPQLQERLKKQFGPKDSVSNDTARTVHRQYLPLDTEKPLKIDTLLANS